MICKGKTPARRRYERNTLRWMAYYAVVLLCSVWFVKHDGQERGFLYFWSVVPAVPVIAVIWGMSRYLKEEADEYQRLLTMQAILVGTAALLGAVVVNDFLRSFAGLAGLPPFALFLTFCVPMAATQWLQKLRDKATGDE